MRKFVGLAACVALFLLAGSAAAETPPGGRYGTLIGPQRVVVRDLPRTAAVSEQRLPVIPRLVPQTGVRATADGAAQVPQTTAEATAARPDPQPMASPALSANFEGLDDWDNVLTVGFGLTPPDPQIAVGPDHIFEMVNVTGRIFDKSGGVLQTFSLPTFFAVPSGWWSFDPKVIYDSLSGRWFASFASYQDNQQGSDYGRLHLAVSQSSDPTGKWNVYSIPFTDVFPDYPGIGVTDDKFTISANIFGVGDPWPYFGEQTIVVEKSDVMAGEPEATTFSFPINADRFTVRPAHSLTSVSDQYLATFDTSSYTTLTYIRITGTPDAGNVTEASATNKTILYQDSPPPSVTAGPGEIDSGDWRALEAIWRDGRLWTSASAACTPPGDTSTRSCAHLIEVDTDTDSLVNDIMFGAAGEYFSWPAIRTDSSGNLHVSLTHTSPSIFAEAAVAGRLATDPPNTMSGWNLLRAGEIVHNTDRWGDYLGAAVDPSLPMCIWVVGEYAKDIASKRWGTYIGLLGYDDVCMDRDGDEFGDVVELYVGTSPLDACADTSTPDDEADDKWPLDMDDNQVADTGDVLAYAGLVSPPTSVPPGDQRLDLDPNSIIDTSDVLTFAGKVAPPTYCA